MFEHVRELCRDAWRDALAVLFPVECAGCGAPDRAVCAPCGRLLDSAGVSRFEEQVLPGAIRVVSALRYQDDVRHMILGFKEHGRTDITRALAVPLRRAVERVVAGEVCGAEVCVVPASARSQRRRGYRPVEVLVRAAGFRVANMLSYSPESPASKAQQKSLDLVGRSKNLRGALIAAPAARGRRFVIVDDVVTSGATLREAARALRAAGAEVVGAATLAGTPRRNAHHSTFSVLPRDIHSQGGYGG